MNRLVIRRIDGEQHGATVVPREAGRCTQLSLGRLLRRANRIVQSTVEARFGAADLNFTQWIVLDLIEGAGSLTVSDLAVSMEITSGALSRVVDGLVARGLVERHRGMIDRRVVVLHLTEAGYAKFEAIQPLAAQRWEEVLTTLSAEEARRLCELLGKFVESAERTAAATRHRLIEG